MLQKNAAPELTCAAVSAFQRLFLFIFESVFCAARQQL